MMFGIRVKQSSNHSLVLRIVFLRLDLEEVDTTFAQGDGDLDPRVLKSEILRPG